MSDAETIRLARVPTGIAGLDTILRPGVLSASKLDPRQALGADRGQALAPKHTDGMRKPLNGSSSVCSRAAHIVGPSAIADKLRSYGVAQRHLLPDVEHRQSRYLNNRAENSPRRRDDVNGRCSGSSRLAKP